MASMVAAVNALSELLMYVCMWKVQWWMEVRGQLDTFNTPHKHYMYMYMYYLTPFTYMYMYMYELKQAQ